jgi:3-oxoacyl-[acyl-carrier-protein] synthase II
LLLGGAVIVMTRRAVITGLGTINPLSSGAESFFSALLDGRDGIGPIEAFDVSGYGCTTGGTVRHLATPLLDAKEQRLVDRASKLLLAAAHEAFEDAELRSLDEQDRARASLFTGTTLGGLLAGEAYYRQLIDDPATVRPAPLLGTSLHAANDLVMSKLGLRGASMVLSTACSASAHAIGHAFDLIRSGQSTLALAGGFESLSEVTYSGFSILRSMTGDRIRPFDGRRSGLVLGEGAAVLVLEELEHALKRGAVPYAEIVGYGSTSDAYHMTAPHPRGEGAARAIALALADGKISPDQVDYVTAHGTATRANDSAETYALKSALGTAARSVPVSSIKSMIGHLLGAAGATGAVAAILAIDHSAIPPTINYAEPDPECDLDYVPNEGRDARVDLALANSFGFGGNNCVLAFKRLAA